MTAMSLAKGGDGEIREGDGGGENTLRLEGMPGKAEMKEKDPDGAL